MSVVELNAVTGVRQYLGHETLEFQQFFLGHVMFLLKERPNAARVEHDRAPAGRCDARRRPSRYRSGSHLVDCGEPAYAPDRRAGRPGRRRDFQRQNNRKPARCHLTTVSGRTMASMSRLFGSRWQTQPRTTLSAIS